MWGDVSGKSGLLFKFIKLRHAIGGEGGIRTHVPGNPDHLISSQRRYGHFGTSPVCGEQRVLFYQFFSLFIVELLCVKGYHLYYCSIWQERAGRNSGLYCHLSENSSYVICS